jgi:glutamate synthase (NADPH/NADH) large chain
MAELGFKTMNDMIGRVDKLEADDAIDHWKAKKLDLSPILYKPYMPNRIKPYCVISQDHGLDYCLDYKLIQMAKSALDEGKAVRGSYEIKNLHRSVGAMTSGEIARKYGHEGLPEDTIEFTFRGSAGQSFGAFGARGLTLILEGDANDYVGKGLSGAKLILKTPEGAAYKQDQNFIAGNTILYGATSGEVYLNGRAGERFAVRNSGAAAVVEGVGAHGLEYMTGGTVVVIGKAGRNFAAGMSGGIAYVLDENGDFEGKVNREMVEIEGIEEEDDRSAIYYYLSRHYKFTGSKKAEMILNNFEEYIPKFKKVIPSVYKAILKEKKKAADFSAKEGKAV